MRPKLYVILDSETTREFFPVFDLAWSVIDKSGKIYSEKNYFMFDSIERLEPKWLGKVEQYKWIDVRRESFHTVNTQFHNEMRCYDADLVMVSYNAAFDRDALNLTAQLFNVGRRFIRVKHQWVDLWGYWCRSAPKSYKAKDNRRGVPSTTLENVYRFESGNPSFKKRGTALEDMRVCRELFLKVLQRRKKFGYTNPEEEFEAPWKLFSQRFSTSG